MHSVYLTTLSSPPTHNRHHNNKKQQQQQQQQQKKRNAGGSRTSHHLESELSTLGLRIHHVTADGNCFFHALGDQLYGQSTTPNQATDLRKTVVDYIRNNRDSFDPFIEDDEPFEDYVNRMGEVGTWAGHMELHAASLSLGVNITVYQAGQPPWVVRNSEERATPMLHLSYHDDSHYNSVRAAHDFGNGPPQPIALMRTGTGNNEKWAGDAMQRVMQGTGSEDEKRVVEALDKARGDVDAAIELMIDDMAAAVGGEGEKEQKQVERTNREEEEEGGVRVRVEIVVENGSSTSRGQGERLSLLLRVGGEECCHEGGSGNEPENNKMKNKKNTRKGSNSAQPSRNQKCRCGSTKKYKNCCGAVAAAAARTTIESENDNSNAAALLERLYI